MSALDSRLLRGNDVMCVVAINPQGLPAYQPAPQAGRGFSRRRWVAVPRRAPVALCECLSCLVPSFDGASLSHDSKEALWDKFYTAAPPRRRQSVEQYKIVKRA